jgi:3-hydroxyisobutyrate dehydrogenase-like beta-hydroxyacid dehydrogenase
MGKRVARHSQGQVTFELAMARKDIGLMLETGGAEGMGVLPGLAVAMDALIDAGHGQDNYTAVSAPKP